MLTAMKCSGQHAFISGSNILLVCITFIEFKNVSFVVSFSYFLSFTIGSLFPGYKIKHILFCG